MNWIDIIVLSILGVCTIIGIWKGLFLQIARLLTLFVSFYFAIYYHSAATGFVENFIEEKNTANVVSYLVMFVACYVILFIITILINKLIKKAKLSTWNRLLGGVVGFFKAVILCWVLLIIFAIFPSPEIKEHLKESKTSKVILTCMKPVLLTIPTKYREEVDKFQKRTLDI